MYKTQKHRIPCTVAILTYNSSATLERALESVRNFQDIIICDGGSSDRTLEIARSFGARILSQNMEFKNSNGSLKDFGGARNQTLEAAEYDWFLFVDSDEYLSKELNEEIASVVSENIPAAYWVPRLYVWKNNIIHCASTYPNRQMRFFHRSISKRFIKEVHERIELEEGVFPKVLSQSLLVPFLETVGELKQKWQRYIIIEVNRRGKISFIDWIRSTIRNLLIAVLYSFRTIRNMVFCRKKSMPLKFEVLRIWYQFALILAFVPSITSLGVGDKKTKT